MLRAMSVNSDVLCLVETRHTPEAMPALDKVAKTRGWHGCWGPNKIVGYPRAAGAAIFSRMGRPALLDLPQELQSFADDGHLLVASCPARGLACPITIACVYGYTSSKTCSDEQARQRTRNMLFELDSFMSQFLNTGMCIAGDFNLPPADSAIQWLTRNGLWRHAVIDFHDVEPEMTCFTANTASCIDHILVGQKMAHIQCDGWVMDGGSIRPHCPVGVEFNLQTERVA
eukprot:2818689-Amphidinium_carterae.3